MKRALIIFLILFGIILFSEPALAQQKTTVPIPKIGINVGTADNPQDVSVTLQLLLLLTILSLAPAIMLMTTSFLRLIIVLNFLRNALGTQQMPPTQLLAGMAI